MATSSSDKKFFDVSKPGKTPAGSTSRPVIVTNRPMVKDSTLRTEDEKADDKPLPLLKSEGKIVAPLNDSEEKSTAKPDEVPEEETAEDKPQTEDKTEAPVSEDASEPDAKTDSDAGTGAVDDDQIDPGRKDQKKAVELSAAEKARQEHIERLVQSGKYSVPVGHIKRNRRARRAFSVIILVLLLGIVTADLLVDAGIVKTDIKLPVDLIKN